MVNKKLETAFKKIEGTHPPSSGNLSRLWFRSGTPAATETSILFGNLYVYSSDKMNCIVQKFRSPDDGFVKGVKIPSNCPSTRAKPYDCEIEQVENLQ